MSYVASKIFGFLILPSSLLALAILVGLLLVASSRRGLGLLVAAGGLAGLIVAGLSPIGNLLVVPLEERFPPPAAGAMGDIAGIVILGGAEDGWVSERRGGLALNEAAERVTEGIRLALRHPTARVAFTGGVGRVMPGEPSGANAVSGLMEAFGIEGSRIILEQVSRNTYENAKLLVPKLAAKPGERWVLVTSAYHMPRAVGVFRAAGLDVLAYPVDYRTAGWIDADRWFLTGPAGLARVDMAVREWVGLLGYWMSGRSDALFPSPRQGGASNLEGRLGDGTEILAG
ncbi:MAG: YdcF family protein [Hyphomicrobiaceae bacterium]|nr:YdcF family protein [Hyphomicrobiaceae bacterium]